jgi:hypothetical protein
MSAKSLTLGRRSEFKAADDRRHVVVKSTPMFGNITRVSPEKPVKSPWTLSAAALSRICDQDRPTADRAKATVMVKIKFREYDQKVLPEMSANFLSAAVPVTTRPIESIADRAGGRGGDPQRPGGGVSGP